MKLTAEAAIQIQKPITQVFEAIVDPAKMSNYFIAKSSGRMEEGRNLVWMFPEFEKQVPVRVVKIVPNKTISFAWGDAADETVVEITLEPKENVSTLVSVSENEKENDETGIGWLKRNTMGWSNFLACLKAYLEYDVNLRKGAFDFMRI